MFIIKKLIDRFGSKPITRITTLDVDSFETFLLDKHKIGYAHRVFSLFKQTLKHALKLKYVSYNVAENYYIPKGKRDFQTWDENEAHSFLNSLDISIPKQHLLYCFVHFYFYTGVRPNEGLSIRWDDLDFNNKEVSIKQILIKESGKATYR